MGAKGQDATILSQLLVNHDVFSMSRHNSDKLNPDDEKYFVCDIREARTIAEFCSEYEISCIINCAAKSSVADSWHARNLVSEINALAVGNLLMELSRVNYGGSFYQLGSTDMYGAEEIVAIHQDMKPWSPYGQSKAYAFERIRAMQEKNFRAFNIILTNHDSNLRPAKYVIKQIATEIASQLSSERKCVVKLQNPKIMRDWAYANDICQGIAHIATNEIEEDLIFATGVTMSLEELIKDVSHRFSSRIDIVLQSGNKRMRDFDRISVNERLVESNAHWKADFLGADTLELMINEQINGKNNNVLVK